MRLTHFEERTTIRIVCTHLQCIPAVEYTKSSEVVESVPVENEEERRVRVTDDHPISVVEDSVIKSKGEQYALENGGYDRDNRRGRRVNGGNTRMQRRYVIGTNWIAFRSALSLLCEK
jgi:hypothetical protein